MSQLYVLTGGARRPVARAADSGLSRLARATAARWEVDMIDATRHRSLTLLTGAMLSWGPLSAQDTGVVVGHLVEHVIKQPVENGLVGLEGAGHAAFTDFDGRFRFTGVSAR